MYLVWKGWGQEQPAEADSSQPLPLLLPSSQPGASAPACAPSPSSGGAPPPAFGLPAFHRHAAAPPCCACLKQTARRRKCQNTCRGRSLCRLAPHCHDVAIIDDIAKGMAVCKCFASGSPPIMPWAMKIALCCAQLQVMLWCANWQLDRQARQADTTMPKVW